MNILHIIIGLHVGGAELMLKRLIQSHDGHGDFRHTVISLTTIGIVGTELRARGISVHALGMRSLLSVLRVLWQLVRLIRIARPDIVQTWMYHADLLGGSAARLAGNRNVIWGVRTTDANVGSSRVTPWVRKACARLSRLVPHTIVCAAEASRRVHEAVGYDAHRMVVVPNGFNLSRMFATAQQRASLRDECGFRSGDVVVGTLGRFNRAKHQENFVRAAGLLTQQHPSVRFLMVGRDLDDSNTELKHWIAQTGHADRFVLLGERADVPICLAAMDIFCLSSRTEGFPNVVGEAMAMGVPCAVTNVGDAAMLVGDAGVVVPKEDSAALAQGLESLLAITEDGRRELGQRAKARVYSEFSMERARERFEAVYSRVLVGDARVIVPKKDSTALAQGSESSLAKTKVEQRKLGQRAKARVYAGVSLERARERFEAVYLRLTGKGDR